MAQQPPAKSPDGQWFWDGTQWKSLVSPDGRSLWTGTEWQPLPPGATVSAPPPPPPGAGSQLAAMPPPPPPMAYGAPAPAFGQPLAYPAVQPAGFWIRFLA